MLHRIEVNVVDVTRKVVGVPQGVLPIPPLPNAALASGSAAFRDCLAKRQRARERRLDQPPPNGKIGIPFGQGPDPDGMKVIGQDDDRFHGEWMPRPSVTKRSAQEPNV